jgi:hypothetical protein
LLELILVSSLFIQNINLIFQVVDEWHNQVMLRVHSGATRVWTVEVIFDRTGTLYWPTVGGCSVVSMKSWSTTSLSSTTTGAHVRHHGDAAMEKWFFYFFYLSGGFLSIY